MSQAEQQQAHYADTAFQANESPQIRQTLSLLF